MFSIEIVNYSIIGEVFVRIIVQRDNCILTIIIYFNRSIRPLLFVNAILTYMIKYCLFKCITLYDIRWYTRICIVKMFFVTKI